MDLVAEVAPEIVRRGGQIAILGIGDPETEELLHAVVRNHRDHIALLSGFNEPMAHRIMAGSDFYLMPSRFEPCGLSQLHAQRYGSIPVAHATGGLVDTVEDGETGFLFARVHAGELHRRDRACLRGLWGTPRSSADEAGGNGPARRLERAGRELTSSSMPG